MNRIVLLTLAAAAIATARTPKIPGQSDCGLNEKFAECSTMCEEKCGEYELTRPCPASCGPPKCQCDVGFYRNNNTGACIMRAQCDEAAPAQSCAAVSCLFGETCVEEPLPCLVAPCPTRAVCKPPNKNCEKKNEIWSQCFTGCEATCQQRIKMCTLQCGPGGCQCGDGYIRDEKTGECVLEKDCPNPCAANEQYDMCFHGCEDTCTQPNKACTEQCGPGGCRCGNGFVRDPVTKLCIKQSACRKE